MYTICQYTNFNDNFLNSMPINDEIYRRFLSNINFLEFYGHALPLTKGRAGEGVNPRSSGTRAFPSA